MNVVKFKYYDDFQCVGTECKDTCCKEWHIFITKREYLDYKKMKCSPELRGILDSAFTRRKEGSDFSYAEVKLTKEGKCPLLGNDSLCMIQKELGAKALSATCNIFPRNRSFIGHNTLLESCMVTCYHVVELLMQHPEGLEIVEEEYDKNDSYINKGVSSGYNIDQSLKEYPYFWDILNAKIDILQNRNFTIPERLLILGYFCRKANEYINNDTMDKIPGLAAMLLDNELCGKIADSLKPPRTEGETSGKALQILLNMRERVNVDPDVSSHTKSLFARIFEQLKCEEAFDEGENQYRFSISEYLKLCERFRAIENERTYIIENLLVNLLFSYDPKKGVWGNYFDIAVFYNVLKVCAPVFLPENYNDTDLALALTNAVKMLLNSTLANQISVCDFSSNDQYTLPYAAFLIC